MHGGKELVAESYYSIGGGFVLTEAEIGGRAAQAERTRRCRFRSATPPRCWRWARASGLSIAAMKRANEMARGIDDLDARRRWRSGQMMNRCIDRGLRARTAYLPGGLNVKRRAKRGSTGKLVARAGANDAPLHSAIDWLQAYAMAVNEENAAGGQVVTAPTNGAAGRHPGGGPLLSRSVPGASRYKVSGVCC